MTEEPLPTKEMLQLEGLAFHGLHLVTDPTQRELLNSARKIMVGSAGLLSFTKAWDEANRKHTRRLEIAAQDAKRRAERDSTP